MNIMEQITNFLMNVVKEEKPEKKDKVEKKVVPGEDITSNFDKEQILDFVKQTYNTAFEVKRQYMETWDKVWELYNNKYDFSQKASWQAKAFTTKFNASIKTFLTIIKRTVLGTKKFFSVQGVGVESKQKQLNVERLLEYWITKTNFRNELTKAIMAGLLSNLCILKCYWNDGIQIECCDPYYVTLDPTGRNKFIIHQIKLDYYDVKRLAEKGIYDMEAVNSIQEDFVRMELEYREKLKKGETTKKPSFRKEVEIMEYYGDIFDEVGNIIAENVIVTIANEKYVLRIVPNPYPIRPFFIAPLCFKPFSVYHKNFYEDVVNSGLVNEMTRVLNGIIDGHLFSIAKSFEVNIDVVYDPEELKSGISPGKVFKRISGMPEQMIREINIGNISQQNLAVYEILSREFQNATAITEFIMGLPTSRGRPTATEVMYKSQQSINTIQDIATDLENYLITPLLEFMFDLIMKYQNDFTDAELQEFLGDHIDYNMSVDLFKQKYLTGKYKFTVNGLSSTLLRSQIVEKISMLLQVLQVNPNWLQQINFEQLLYKILEGLDLDPTEILLPTRQEQPQQTLPPTIPVGETLPADLLGATLTQPVEETETIQEEEVTE